MNGYAELQGTHLYMFYMFMVIISNRVVLRNFMTISV